MAIDDDYCTLEPTKICDNCCKCLEPGEAYRVIHADMHIEDMQPLEAEEDDLPEEYLETTDIPLDEDVEEYEDDEFEFGKNIPPIEIDPALMAEWEKKLADLDADQNDRQPKLYGVRRKRES